MGEGEGRRKKERRKRRRETKKGRWRKEGGKKEVGRDSLNIPPPASCLLERGDMSFSQQPSEVLEGCLVSGLPWAVKKPCFWS